MKTACYYFNWGGGDEGRPSYPQEYGARCEKQKMFFPFPVFLGRNPREECKGCSYYNRKKRRPSSSQEV